MLDHRRGTVPNTVTKSMPYFPSQAWLEAYGRRLNESDRFGRAARRWGKRFNGDVIFEMRNLPIDERTVADLPPAVRAEIGDGLLAAHADRPLADLPSLEPDERDQLPPELDALVEQLDDLVVDGTVYAYLGLERGRCTGVDALASRRERDVGYVIAGEFDYWKRMIDGRLNTVTAITSGRLSVRGRRFRLLRYRSALRELSRASAEVETTHLF